MTNTPSLLPWVLLLALTDSAVAETLPLSALDLTKVRQGWGKAGVDVSVDGKPLSVGGQKFESGIGTHSASLFFIDVKKATRFTASVGVDDEVANTTASIEFLVYGDGKILWRSGVMKAGEAAKKVDVDLTGVAKLMLRVTDGGDGNSYDHADWGNVKIEFSGEAPVAVSPGSNQPVRLTPPTSPLPRINGAKVFGVRPGAPLLFQIAASGQRPLRFEARLPHGVQLNTQSGQLSGKLEQKGEYRIPVTVSNALGKTTRDLVIKVGEDILLTPPMGWNSWYQMSEAVSDADVRNIARAMKAKRLTDFGWTYVNIDDCWQGERGGAESALQPNERFPDMKSLTAEIHSLGLKAGIYSTPWMGTYAGFRGSSAPLPDGSYPAAIPLEKRLQPHQIFGRYPGTHSTKMDRVGPHWFFDRDARQFAAWGFDYIKMDWLPNDVPTTKRIADDLRTSGRDIALSLSNAAPFSEAGGLSAWAQAWRTTGDIRDEWSSIAGIASEQEKWAPFTRPGHWNDPDMLQVGNIGTPNQFNTAFRPTQLTPDEQYFQVSLWSLLSAPLLLSCDIATLDDFTLGLLTNAEVIDVNQDSLGKPARRIALGEHHFAWVKPLEDGSLAVGLFNVDELESQVTLTPEQLGVTKTAQVRDLWRQQNLGVLNGEFSTRINAHGVALLKISAN